MKAKLYNSECEQALLERVCELMKNLEATFGYDWDHSELTIKHTVLTEGRVPNVLDPREPVGSWASKENLTDSYLELKAFMLSENLLPSDFED